MVINGWKQIYRASCYYPCVRALRPRKDIAKSIFLFLDILEAMTSATVVTTSINNIALFLSEDVSKSSLVSSFFWNIEEDVPSLCFSGNLMPQSGRGYQKVPILDSLESQIFSKRVRMELCSSRSRIRSRDSPQQSGPREIDPLTATL